MCPTPKVAAPPPPPAPPPVLEQVAPKSAASAGGKKRRKGLSAYKIDAPAQSRTNKLGGIPKKTGV